MPGGLAPVPTPRWRHRPVCRGSGNNRPSWPTRCSAIDHSGWRRRWCGREREIDRRYAPAIPAWAGDLVRGAAHPSPASSVAHPRTCRHLAHSTLRESCEPGSAAGQHPSQPQHRRQAPRQCATSRRKDRGLPHDGDPADRRHGEAVGRGGKGRDRRLDLTLGIHICGRPRIATAVACLGGERLAACGEAATAPRSASEEGQAARLPHDRNRCGFTAHPAAPGGRPTPPVSDSDQVDQRQERIASPALMGAMHSIYLLRPTA